MTTKTRENSRTRQTDQRIQKALIELVVEKGYESVRVQDIVERAAVNRSTFYRHYLDKDDVLSKYMDEVTGVNFKDDADEGRSLTHHLLVW